MRSETCNKADAGPLKSCIGFVDFTEFLKKVLLMVNQCFDVFFRCGEIQLPILVLHGLNDGWISPVEAVQIAKAARNNADIILFKGLGHSLSKVSSPLKDEGGTIEDEVIVRVVKWLKKNVE